MKIDDILIKEKEKYQKIKVKLLLFETLALMILIPSIWLIPQYFRIKHAIGITIINCFLYGLAILKEKQII